MNFSSVGIDIYTDRIEPQQPASPILRGCPQAITFSLMFSFCSLRHALDLTVMSDALQVAGPELERRSHLGGVLVLVIDSV